MSIVPTIPRRLSAPADGLLLVGHGSNEAVGVNEFLQLANRMRAVVNPLPLEPAFLEFAEPTIGQAFARLARRGARHIAVVPALLFAAAHAKRDIPAALAEAAADFAGVELALSDHLGCHESIVRQSQQRYDEALEGVSALPAEEMALVIVGRGSRDRGAIDEMRRFVALRGQSARASRVEAAFVAMAEPNVPEVLRRLTSTQPRRIVVQPHLLFGGVLVDRIEAIVAQFSREHADIDWRTAAPLGPSELVCQALVDCARTLWPLSDSVTSGISSPAV